MCNNMAYHMKNRLICNANNDSFHGIYKQNVRSIRFFFFCKEWKCILISGQNTSSRNSCNRLLPDMSISRAWIDTQLMSWDHVQVIIYLLSKTYLNGCANNLPTIYENVTYSHSVPISLFTHWHLRILAVSNSYYSHDNCHPIGQTGLSSWSFRQGKGIRM